MHVRRLNKAVFEWTETHPARRFLEAFITFRKSVIGGNDKPRIDQKFVMTDGTQTSFMAFVFEYLAFDIVLDGWLTNAAEPTPDERGQMAILPYMREQLLACRAAAVRDGNNAILHDVDFALSLLTLWEECIATRLPHYSAQLKNGVSGASAGKRNQ